jgi:hypothetical protein
MIIIDIEYKLALTIISPRVDMSLHTDMLSWFRANQSLLLLLNTECLHTNYLVFGLIDIDSSLLQTRIYKYNLLENWTYSL